MDRLRKASLVCSIAITSETSIVYYSTFQLEREALEGNKERETGVLKSLVSLRC